MLKGLALGAGGSYESPRLYLSGLTHGGGQQITDKNGNSIMLRTKSRHNIDLMVRYTFKLAERDTSVQLNVNNVLSDQTLRLHLLGANHRPIECSISSDGVGPVGARTGFAGARLVRRGFARSAAAAQRGLRAALFPGLKTRFSSCSSHPVAGQRPPAPLVWCDEFALAWAPPPTPPAGATIWVPVAGGQ